MLLDWAWQNLKTKEAIFGDGINPGDTRVGIVVTDDRVASDGRLESLTDVHRSRPQSAVVGHVHEVDGDVVDLSHWTSFTWTSLTLQSPTGVGDRAIEAAIQPHQGQFGEVCEHDSEVGMVEGWEQREPGFADPTERREPHLSVANEPLAPARLLNGRVDDTLNRDPKHAVDGEGPLGGTMDTVCAHDARPKYHRRVVGRKVGPKW